MRSLTNSSGTPTDQYDYTAFGELKNYSGSSTPNNYQYTGQQFDDEIDLYSLRARYYDPANGRFLSKDTWPIDLQNPIELNRYVYTANNPVTLSDPSGLTTVLFGNSKIQSIMGSLATYFAQGYLAPLASVNVGWALGINAVLAGVGYILGGWFADIIRGRELNRKADLRIC